MLIKSVPSRSAGAGSGGATAFTQLTDVPSVYVAKSRLRVNNAATALEFFAAEFVNVKADFGAKGDGVTDDTDAIQAAINSLASTGGIVYLPPGTYLVSASLTITSYGICLMGAGRNATILKAMTNSMNTVTVGDGVNPCQYSSIKSLSFLTGVTKSGGSAIEYNAYASWTNFEDFHINGQYYGITFNPNCVVNFVDKGAIYNTVASTGVGINVLGGNDQYISRVVMDNTPTLQPLAGIQIQNNLALWIDMCDVIHSGTGLLINPGNGQLIQWLFIHDSAFDTCGQNGIAIEPTGSGTVEGCDFVGTWAATAANSGVLLGGGGTLDSVHFVGHRSFNNGHHGIEINNGVNVMLDASQFAGNAQAASGSYDGVYVAPNVSKFNIRNCRSGQAAGFANSQRYGINLASGTSNNYMITNNDTTLNVTGGVYDGGSGANKVVNNNLS